MRPADLSSRCSSIDLIQDARMVRIAVEPPRIAGIGAARHPAFADSGPSSITHLSFPFEHHAATPLCLHTHTQIYIYTHIQMTTNQNTVSIRHAPLTTQKQFLALMILVSSMLLNWCHASPDLQHANQWKIHSIRQMSSDTELHLSKRSLLNGVDTVINHQDRTHASQVSFLLEGEGNQTVHMNLEVRK